MAQTVEGMGQRLDSAMIPKVEGSGDAHFVDRYLAMLEACHGIKKPVFVQALLETAEGVNCVHEIVRASPRTHGLSLGPADLAASRGMKTARAIGGHSLCNALVNP